MRLCKIIQAYAQAFGALGCDSTATAAVYLNGWKIGTHGSAGSCNCGSCAASSTMLSANYNNGASAMFGVVAADLVVAWMRSLIACVCCSCDYWCTLAHV